MDIYPPCNNQCNNLNLFFDDVSNTFYAFNNTYNVNTLYF